jgi:hypothetical protein
LYILKISSAYIFKIAFTEEPFIVIHLYSITFSEERFTVLYLSFVSLMITSPQSNVLLYIIITDMLRTVRVSLLSDNIHNTVSSILRSCNLPLDYINSIKPQTATSPGPDRPIKWDPSFYTFYGIPNPEVNKYTVKRSVQTLR